MKLLCKFYENFKKETTARMGNFEKIKNKIQMYFWKENTDLVNICLSIILFIL